MTTLHDTLEQAVRVAVEGAKARDVDEEDGKVIVCRPSACPNLREPPVDGCPFCVIAEPGTSVEEIMARLRGN